MTEPTDKQREAARKYIDGEAMWVTVDALADFLAQRDECIRAEAKSEVWSEAGDMAATYGAPVMRDDAERGFYVACENLRDEFRKKAAALAALRPKPEPAKAKEPSKPRPIGPDYYDPPAKAKKCFDPELHECRPCDCDQNLEPCGNCDLCVKGHQACLSPVRSKP